VSRKKPGSDVIDLGARRKAERTPRVTNEQLVKTLCSVLSGVLLFLSCADFDIWPLTWFAVVPLIAVALHPTTKRPAFYGFVCGLFANGGGFYWIVGFLQRFGHLPLVAAIPIFLLLVGYQAITFTAFAYCIRKLHNHFPNSGITFIAPIVYVALELVVPFVFPWYLAITQAWVRPVIQIADLTGPLGVSFILILTNSAIYDGAASWRATRTLPLRRLAVALAVLSFSFGYGAVRIHQVTRARAAAPKLNIGVVQANIGIHEKWHPQLARQQLQMHQELARSLEQRGADLLVWPESSYPYHFFRDQTHDWPEGDVRQVKVGFHLPLLFGTLTVAQTGTSAIPYPYNSALLLDEKGEVRGSFDKNILMVFGEYVPYYEQLQPILKHFPEMSNFARGTDVTVFPLVRPDGSTVRIGPMICYEDIFPSFGRRLTMRDPNVLINITNDAWFGKTSEPYEHLALAVYRAVESRLDLVRAVNTGVSAFVDATGRLYQHGPSFDPDDEHVAPPLTLLEPVAVLQPFKLYARLGEWFGGLCLIVALALGLVARSRGGQPVRWRLVALGAAALAVAIVVLGAVFCGPGHLDVLWQILTHRPLSADPDLSFRVGLGLLPTVALACLTTGALLARQARGGLTPRLETALAVLAVIVAPATLLGQLEGEQAGLVISALLAIGLALWAGRLMRRYFIRG
jgi:apolipoprotein N-acyltransferase